ncbi:aldo/keto reductase [bacterium]|nr:aldo/keto reductase [bacterium]
MKYRKFGSLDFNVSEVGFGGAAVSGEGGGYGFGFVSETESLNLLHKAHDFGINLFDTAPVYGFGTSEKRIGKAFLKMRDKVFIVSKSGVNWDTNKRIGITNDPKIAEKMLNQSLKDLQTDYIDLFMVHWPDTKFDIRKPLETLAKAKKEGKIRAIGLCNSFPEDIQKASEIEKIDVLQSKFNLFANYPKNELFKIIDEKQLGFMSWGTLDKGILTGTVTPDRKYDKVDARSNAPWWKNADRTPKFNAMKKIMPILEKHNHTGLEMALGYVLQFQQVSTALCGIKNLTQLETSCKALENLPAKEILDEIFAVAEKFTGEK